MLARHAVLLTHSVSVRPADLIPCKRIASVTPLFARLTKSAHLHHSTVFSHPLFSYTCALFCTFLHLLKAQSFCYQAIPHSSAKNTGVWRRGASCGEVATASPVTRHESRFTIRSIIPPRE